MTSVYIYICETIRESRVRYIKMISKFLSMFGSNILYARSKILSELPGV